MNVLNSNGGRSPASVTNVAIGAGLFLGLLFMCALAFWVGYLDGRFEGRGETLASAYKGEAKAAAARSCATATGSAYVDCIFQKAEGSQQNTVAIRTLRSQEWSTIAAIISAAVAFILVFPSVYGVFLVKKTLEATAQAVADTAVATQAMTRQNQLAELSQRPWVKLNANITSFDADLDGYRVVWSVRIQNIGATIAHSVNLFVDSETVDKEDYIHDGEWLGALKDRRTLDSESLMPNDAIQRICGIFIPRPKLVLYTSDALATHLPEMKSLILRAAVHYRSDVSDIWRTTENCFIVEFMENGRFIPHDIEVGPLSSERFTVRYIPVGRIS